jgi:hypothetical protein
MTAPNGAITTSAPAWQALAPIDERPTLSPLLHAVTARRTRLLLGWRRCFLTPSDSPDTKRQPFEGLNCLACKRFSSCVRAERYVQEFPELSIVSTRE